MPYENPAALRITSPGLCRDATFSSKHALHLLSWNIAGWSAKQKNLDLIAHLNKSDIIFVQEMWSTQNLTLDGFSITCLPATPSLPKSKGRPKGGLALLISTSTSARIKSLSSCNNIAMGVLLSYNTISFLLINVYIPPYSSRVLTDQAWEDLDRYITDLEAQSPRALLIIMGDFNARIGPNNDALFASNLWGGEVIDHYSSIYGRISKDSRINYGGICLTRLIGSRNLIMLNGLNQVDPCAEYTYISGQGSSVIDYALISQHLLKTILKFTVGNRQDSDHLPLTLSICLPERGRLTFAHNQMANPLHYTHKRTFWSPLVASNVALFLTSPSGLAIKEKITNATNPFSVLTDYDTLISKLKMSLMLPSPSHRAINRTGLPRWFDKDCLDVKRQLRQTYLHYRLQNANTLPPEYFIIKKKYKSMIVTKKRQAVHEGWKALIHASRTKNSKSFWELVSGSMRPSNLAPCHISSHT
ncbi:uncharacterized protein LOC133386605 [Rhineura floridana]|uniref:uncharacterized protein LOC133386605 n=1 Tax=Rhineura floridana TaxID=261503 RepID=UPI002AC8575D|nr:uncharacterized protein LOC133386605 [Rhineura floridana]